MTALLLILLVVALSMILYMLREHKLKQQHDWHVWTARSSSFPPPVLTVAQPVASIVAVDSNKESEPFLTNEIVHFPVLGNVAKASSVVGSGIYSSGPPVKEMLEPTSVVKTKKQRDNTQDNIPITDMNKQQLDEYLEKNTGRYHNSSGVGLSNATTMVYSEALRLASLDPEEVVYINENQWFHPSACESYPSQTTVGEELLMTIKGSWILKKPGISVPSAYTYQVVSKKDAFIFLESNGFTETAAALAPHNPSCEL